MTKIALVAFDGFRDLDLFLPWDIMNRVQHDDWSVSIVSQTPTVTSQTGLTIPSHGDIEYALEADGVILVSGKKMSEQIDDYDFMGVLENLNPMQQRIGAICSASLILAKLGFLRNKTATTFPTRMDKLAELGAIPIDKSFVRHGKVVTVAGSLASTELCYWMIESLTNWQTAKYALDRIAPLEEMPPQPA